MEYRSQLVIRTRDPREAQVIQKVKEIADGHKASISEVAIALLSRAIDSDPLTDAELGTHKKAIRRTPDTSAEKKPHNGDSGSFALPTADGTPCRSVVRRTCELLQNDGCVSASAFLADFYASANPVEGGRVRVELTQCLPPEEYDELHDSLRSTDQYRAYTRRVVYGN